LISRDASGVAKEATFDGKVVVRVERDFNGLVTGLILADKRIGLEQTEKPRIQSILGKNVVAGKDMSLGKVSSESGILKTYEYGVTDGLQPKITVTDTEKPPRQIAWDSATRLITADGDWKYAIKPSPTKGLNASIGRINNANQEELWFLDSAKGEEKILGIDGAKKNRTWFTSGKFGGKLRSVSFESGKTLKFSYDPNGDLLRISRLKDANSKQATLVKESSIISMVDSGDRSTNHSRARIVRNNIYFDVYDRLDPKFENQLALCISSVNQDGSAITPKLDDIDQIQIATTPSGKLYVRLLNKAGRLLFSSVNQRVYWPIKKNSSI
jgi:hypothetical protein